MMYYSFFKKAFNNLGYLTKIQLILIFTKEHYFFTKSPHYNDLFIYLVIKKCVIFFLGHFGTAVSNKEHSHRL